MIARRIPGCLFAILLASGWALAQCPPRGAGGFQIFGRVVNAADNTDVSFVTLRLEGSGTQQRTVSDAQGRFVFQCLEASTYTVEASKRGFQTATERFNLINSGVNDGVIYLKPLPEAKPTPEAATLSARHAQIPPKARKSFESGVKKLYDENNAKGSIGEFRKAIEMHSDYDDAYIQLGIAYSRTAQLKEAEGTFRKAIEVYAQNSPAHSFLGKLLAEQGRNEEAVPELRKAVELEDSNWLAHLDLARILLKQGARTESYAHARRAHELNTTVEDVHVALYNACASLGKFAEALAELDEVVKLYPKSETAKKLLAIRPKLAAEPAAKTP